MSKSIPVCCEVHEEQLSEHLSRDPLAEDLLGCLSILFHSALTIEKRVCDKDGLQEFAPRTLARVVSRLARDLLKKQRFFRPRLDVRSE